MPGYNAPTIGQSLVVLPLIAVEAALPAASHRTLREPVANSRYRVRRKYAGDLLPTRFPTCDQLQNHVVRLAHTPQIRFPGSGS
jgi:hypothetical protein